MFQVEIRICEIGPLQVGVCLLRMFEKRKKASMAEI